MSRVVCWWSAGAASSVAAMLTLRKHPDAVIAYCDTSTSEHPDNARFLRDCETWFKRSIVRLKSEKYDSTWDVYAKTRYLVGPKGARCTTELKKLVRRAFEKPGDVNVFGYTVDERDRVEKFKQNNPEIAASFPLVDAELTHANCLALVERAGIRLPAMYLLGYRNNNCVGCVKGQAGYWNKIRVDFPEVFRRMVAVERNLGVAINKVEGPGRKRLRVFLDELDPGAGRHENEPAIECGLFCHSVAEVAS